MSRKTYRIADWATFFEKAQNRKVAGPLSWVAVPTRWDGKGFRRLIRMANGPALYGAWILILSVAARCRDRGVLVDDEGPIDAEGLGLKTDAPIELFEQALEVLSSPQIGWLVASSDSGDGGPLVADYHHATTTIPPHCQSDTTALPAGDHDMPATIQNKTVQRPGAESDGTSEPEGNGRRDGKPAAQQERQPAPAKPSRGPWASLTSEMILDAAGGNPGALLRHWQYCVNLRAVPDVESSRLEFLATAVSVAEFHKKSPGANVAALFVTRWKGDRKAFTSDGQEETARQILRRFDAAQRKPAPEAVEAANAMRSAATAEEVGIYMDGGDE